MTNSCHIDFSRQQARAVNTTSAGGPLYNITVANKWMTGATYTLRFGNDDNSRSRTANLVARNNRFIGSPQSTLFKEASQYRGEYAPVWEPSLAEATDSGSVWDDNGAPVLASGSYGSPKPPG